MGDGIYTYHLELINDVDDSKQNHLQFYFSQNYPNPFNPTTTITYQLPVGSNVNLKVFNILGNDVKTLINEYKPAGKYFIDFNAGNLSSGIYFYQIKTDIFFKMRKMVILK
jgi:hypothetical protein